MQNLFQRFLVFIREVINKMLATSDVKTALGVDLVISNDMALALQKWSNAYINKPYWHKTGMALLNLPAGVAAEIARAVTIEMKMKITGSKRADYMNEVFEYVIPTLRVQMEYAVAKGGMVFKPYVKDGKLCFDWVQADMFYPVAFDSNKMTACVFSATKVNGQSIYTRLELHRLVPQGYEIINAVYKSESRESLGSKVPIDSVMEWKGLPERVLMKGVDHPLFAYFKNPFANNIDPTSPLGVSGYARAMDLMEQADQQWTDFLWEFKSGRRAVYADEQAFELDTVTNTRKLPDLLLYRTLKAASVIGDKNKLIEEWTPTLREINLLNGLDGILKRIEFNCGLAVGTLSDPNAVALTATEIKMSKQRTYATVTDTQKSLQTALDDLLYAVDTWITVYGLAPEGTYTATYDFDDSIVTDHDSQFTQDTQMVGMRAMGRVELRMRTYKESREEAEKMIKEADEEQKMLNENSLIDQGT
jgi:A118 family predicted phage portal protein